MVIYLLEFNDESHTMYIGETSDFHRTKKRQIKKLETGSHKTKVFQDLYDSGYDPNFHVVKLHPSSTLRALDFTDCFSHKKDYPNINLVLARKPKEYTVINIKSKKNRDFIGCGQIARHLKCSKSCIEATLSGRLKTIKGHRVFLKGQVPDDLSLPPTSYHLMREVRLTNIKTRKTKEFESIVKAAIFLGDPKRQSSICSVLSGKTKTCYGYTAEYI